MDIAYRVIDSIILSTVALVLGLYALKINPRSALNRLLSLICLWFVVRSTTAIFAFAILKDREAIITLFKANFFFYATIFPLNLHFFLRLVIKERPKPWLLVLIYLPMLALCAIAIADYGKIADFVLRDGEWKLRLPPRGARQWVEGTLAAVMAYLATTLASAIIALKRAASNRERKQAAVLIAGLSVYFAAQATQPLFPKALPPSVLVYPLFAHIIGLCYATLRYRFLAPRPSPLTEDLIAHIDDAVFLLDARLQVSYANTAAERFLARGPDGIKGSAFPSLIREGDEAERTISRFQEGGELSLRLRLSFERGGSEVAAACYLSKVKDRFSDLVGVLVIAKELPGRRDFQERFRITGREMEIVDQVLAGSSNKEIGEALGISERTVEAHCLHVYNKLGIGSKAELVKLGAKYDFLG